MSRRMRPRSAITVTVLATAVAVNLIQFPSIERAMPPTWQALSIAPDRDLVSVARARDEAGVAELQFSMVFALREHAPGAAVLVFEPLTVESVLRPELLVGVGGARCVVARPGPTSDLAVEGSPPVVAEGIAGATSAPFVLARGLTVPDVMLVLDQRDEAGRLLLLDSALLPEDRRPEPPC